MKNLILLIPILISLSIIGCTMNYNQPYSDDIIHEASLNVDKLINTSTIDIEKSLGSPYYATYYIDADKLKSKNINSISIEDLKEDVSLLASYKDPKSNNSYLHVYYEDGIVKDVIYGPYKIDNLENLVSTSNISNSDYKVSFIKNNGAIYYKNFSIDNAKKEFIGKTISDFNDSYNLKSANVIASTINESDYLYFYPLVNYDETNNKKYQHDNYSSNENSKLGLVNPLNNNISKANKTNNDSLMDYYKSTVVLYVKDNKIQLIQKANKDFFYKLINDTFNNQ